MRKCELECQQNLYLEDDGVCVRVGVDPDVPTVIRIFTDDEKSNKYWGSRLNISFTIEEAKFLVKAINQQINSMEGN